MWIAIAIPLNECLDGRETVSVFIISAAASVEFSLTLKIKCVNTIQT